MLYRSSEPMWASRISRRLRRKKKKGRIAVRCRGAGVGPRSSLQRPQTEGQAVHNRCRSHRVRQLARMTRRNDCFGERCMRWQRWQSLVRRYRRRERRPRSQPAAGEDRSREAVQVQVGDVPQIAHHSRTAAADRRPSNPCRALPRQCGGRAGARERSASDMTSRPLPGSRTCPHTSTRWRGRQDRADLDRAAARSSSPLGGPRRICAGAQRGWPPDIGCCRRGHSTCPRSRPRQDTWAETPS